VGVAATSGFDPKRKKMASSIQIQYVGFKAKATLREYTFLVKTGPEDACEFKLTIANDAFLSHRVRYQDGPDICAHRVQRELDVMIEPLQKTRCVITDVELADYRAAHSPKPKRGVMYKPSREPF